MSQVGRAISVLFITVISLLGTQTCPVQASTGMTHYGPAGHHFFVTFPTAPTVQTVHFGASQFQRQYGTGIMTRVIIKAGKTWVFVNQLSRRVPANRVVPFLRSFLPVNHAGWVYEGGVWNGLPAANEFVPGCDPSGHCQGAIGSLVVLDGRTLFDIFTTQSNAKKTHAVIGSFRLLP